MLGDGECVDSQGHSYPFVLYDETRQLADPDMTLEEAADYCNQNKDAAGYVGFELRNDNLDQSQFPGMKASSVMCLFSDRVPDGLTINSYSPEAQVEYSPTNPGSGPIAECVPAASGGDWHCVKYEAETQLLSLSE